jgi:hypothetical protein
MKICLQRVRIQWRWWAGFTDANTDLYNDALPRRVYVDLTWAATTAEDPAEKPIAGTNEPVAAPPAAPAAVDTTDYASWPIKELRRYLTERGIVRCINSPRVLTGACLGCRLVELHQELYQPAVQSAAGIVDKGDLVAKVKESAASTAQAAYPVPPGYAYDGPSGLWYSADSAMYFDTRSGGFCDASGKWYSYDAEKGWVEWKQ